MYKPSQWYGPIAERPFLRVKSGWIRNKWLPLTHVYIDIITNVYIDLITWWLLPLPKILARLKHNFGTFRGGFLTIIISKMSLFRNMEITPYLCSSFGSKRMSIKILKFVGVCFLENSFKSEQISVFWMYFLPIKKRGIMQGTCMPFMRQVLIGRTHLVHQWWGWK